MRLRCSLPTLLVLVAACTPATPFETSLSILVDENQDPFGSATTIEVQVYYQDGGDPVHGEINPISGEQELPGLREGLGVVVDIIARDAGGSPVAMGRSQPFDIGPEGGDASVFVGEINSLARIPGGLSSARAFAAGVLTPGGRIVVVGGGDNDLTPTDDIEFIGWDVRSPVQGVDGASFARLGHQLTYVPRSIGGPFAGQVLSLGGTPSGGVATLLGGWQDTDDVIAAIDPVTGVLNDRAGELDTSHALAQLAWTQDDRIALIGGYNAQGQYFDRIRLVDPTDLDDEAGPTIARREQHRVTELSVAGARMVLISGGTINGNGQALATLALWDLEPDSEVDRLPELALSVPRFRHTATALSSGRVLIAGGATGEGSEFDLGESIRSVDIFDPTFVLVTPTEDMIVARQQHTAAAIGEHLVLVCAGVGSAGQALGSCEVFDDSIGQRTWTPFSGGSMSPGGPGVAAVPFPDGRVLFFGGASSSGGPDDSVYLYTPTSLGPP
jgi:hypothetical protein